MKTTVYRSFRGLAEEPSHRLRVSSGAWKAGAEYGQSRILCILSLRTVVHAQDGLPNIEEEHKSVRELVL